MSNGKAWCLLTIVSMFALAACSSSDQAVSDGFAPEAISATIAGGAGARPLKLNHHAVSLRWGITKSQEQACGGPAIAGAEAGGVANFSQLGITTTSWSAAWDIGHLLTGPAQFTPVGPASGPVAPVLAQSAYPYAFQYNPLADACGSGVAATGKVVLTAANGDRLLGDVVGGEAHKLDFIIDGDGVEVFIRVAVTGGTGRFANATGSFVMHAIGRTMPTLQFEIRLLELLPGGAIGY